MRHVALVVIGTVLLAGCGTPKLVEAGNPPEGSYAGPMKLPQNFRDNATVLQRSGAAGRALECDFAPYAGGGGDYTSGLESAQGTATDALNDMLAQELAGTLPDEGYRIERTDDGRVLFSYDVGERTKISLIASDSVRDFDDTTGWGIEAWAECDPAELPSSVTEALGVGVWNDTAGQAAPVAEIQSYQGAEHCGWQDITFLQLGPEGERDEYVRDPSGELSDLLRSPYDPASTLPAGATDTGLRRDGRQLWIGDDGAAAYLVRVGEPEDVERWPAPKDAILCA